VTPDLAIRAAVLLALALAITRLLWRGSAATRHACWRATMTLTLALPLVASAAPRWMLPAPVSEPAAAVLRSVTGPDTQRIAEGARPSEAATPSPAPPSRPPRSPARAGLVWLLGFAAAAGYYASGHARLLRVRRRASPAPLAWSASASKLAARLRLRVTPAVGVSPDVPGPIVAGIWRPTVLIPVEARNWCDTRREAVLMHELAHVARRDVSAQVVAHAVCAVHWFNPLAWIAARAMRRERERACDDAVLGNGVAASTYATELLAIAAGAMATSTPAAALSMARPSEFEGRLLAILARRPRHMSLAARVGIPGLACLSTVLVAGATAATPAAMPVAYSSRVVAPPQAATALWISADANPPAAGRAPTPPADSHDSTPQSRERDTVALALTPGADAIPGLIAALEDGHAGVREKAVVGLMWRRDPRVVPALIDAAADVDAGVRKKAIVALALSGDPVARSIVDAARHDSDADVRETAGKLSLLLH
jgi:beta-lactamase regulating signal transducer with metallopeptidase domain